MVQRFPFALMVVLFTILINNIHPEDVYEPLAIINKSEGVKLAIPDTLNFQQFHIERGEKLVRLCPPEGNENKPLIPYTKGTCKSKLTPVVIPDESAVCSDGAYFTTIGYEINLGGPIKLINIPYIFTLLQWLNKKLESDRLIEIVDFCRKEIGKEVEVLYAMHTLRAYQFLKTKKDPTPNHVPYSAYNDEQNILSQYYNETSQRKSLHKIFENNYTWFFKWPSDTVDEFRYFVPEQLIQSDDMVLNPWKKTTYYIMNTAPMWISVSEGSWERANRYIRLLSFKTKYEFLIFSGTYGNLTISDKTVHLYDDNAKTSITVPLIFWKVLYYGPENAALAIIIYNDIGTSPQEPFCKRTWCPELEQCQLENEMIAEESELSSDHDSSKIRIPPKIGDQSLEIDLKHKPQ